MKESKTFSKKEWTDALNARAEAGAEEFKSFIKTIAALRHPITGCPWDLEQTHESLRRFMIEEAYEAAESMLPSGSAEERTEELGDVLLQVVLNAQLQADNGEGDIASVVKGINQKMIRRHPHVFAPSDKAVTKDEVKANWSEIKAKEKGESKPGIFHKARKIQPSLTQAYAIGKAAQKIDFDWHSTIEVAQQFESEWAELKHEMDADDGEKIADELSDCFFSLAQLARHLGFEPEEIAQRGNLKFMRRFEMMEKLANERSVDISTLGQGQLEKLWREVKASETKA